MKLTTFGSFTLPKAKVETLIPSGIFVDAWSEADEEDGGMPMGTDPMPRQPGEIAVTFIIDRGYLKLTGYDVDEGGLDTALYDFATGVLASGVKTLTAVPSGGTTPKAGLGGAAITNWTCDAEPSSGYSINRHVGQAQAYCEIDMTFKVMSATWKVTTGSGVTTIPVV